MDPLIGASLIKLGGGFLNSIFQPSLSKQISLQNKGAQDMATWRAGQVSNALKPATPYYSSGNLPMLGGNAMSAVMGNLAQRMGPALMSKWGIQMPGQTPAPAGPPAGPPAAPQRFAGQDLLRRRYGA